MQVRFLIELVSAAEYRYPQASAAVTSAGSWIVGTGPVEEVLPLGVRPNANFGGNQPTHLDATLHEVIEDLRLTATLPPEEASHHLLEHTRRYLMPHLCKHGMPLWHLENEAEREKRKGSCKPAGVPGMKGPAVRVDQVIAMITTLDAVIDGVHRLQRQRKPLSKSTVEQILTWPVLDWPAGNASRVYRQQAPDSVEVSKGLIRQVLQRALEHSALKLMVSWQTWHRPQLIVEANSPAALYIYEVLQQTGLVADEDRTFTCQSCGESFSPRRAPTRGEGHYCSKPECQRERQRRNQARSRARKKGSTL